MDDSMTRRIYKMFELGRIMGHGACRDKVQILYPDLGLSCLPLSENTNEFLAKISTVRLEARAN